MKNWERSGQGEGTQVEELEGLKDVLEVDETIHNRDPDDLSPAELGYLENRSAFALHSHQYFLDHPGQGKVGSWILYFWEQLE